MVVAILEVGMKVGEGGRVLVCIMKQLGELWFKEGKECILIEGGDIDIWRDNRIIVWKTAEGVSDNIV